MSIEKEAEAFVSEKADKGNFDVEKFGKAYFSESSMKQALVKFAEPREKRIAELEKDKAYAEEQLDEQIQATLKLQKENAKLKAEIENDRDLPTVAYMQGAENQKKKDEKQLAKAKEHIRTLISCLIDWVQEGDKDYCYIADAEQFLKEIEK